MGLFITEDGQYQGWLAAFLCCFAAVNEDESPNEKRKAQDRSHTCNEQPQRLMTSHSFTSVLTLNAFKGDEPMIHGTRQTFRISETPPSLLPLDLGEYPLLGSLPAQHHPRSFGLQDQCVSAPSSFRRFDYSDTQRQPLIPLRLGPVVLRESPDAHTGAPVQPKPSLIHGSENSTLVEEFSTQDERPRSYRASRESPFQRCRYQASPIARTPPGQGPYTEVDSAVVDLEQPTPTRPPSSTRSSSSSVRRHGVDTPASSITSRTSSERVRPKRKRSFGLARRDGAEQLEQEILELNTIVEERRAENARDSSQDQHIPALAPSMQIRARSETLDAIGSALSRPLAMQSPQPDVDPFNSNTPKRESTQQHTSDNSWRRSRLSGWLFGILPSSPPTHQTSGEPFYKCQPPAQHQRELSEMSGCTSLSECNSPSITVASSPASRGHRRNFTDESRTTPLSPTLHSRTISKTDVEGHWSGVARSTGEVGLAL